MLPGCRYKPAKDAIIYQYCGATAFFGITQTKTLWFSDVFAMNDFMEMKWGYSVFEKAATELLDKIPRDFLDRVDEHIGATGNHILPLVTCFSLDSDVLSQWRAYSEDGSGFAVGFVAEQLVQMPVKPLRVIYDEREQIEEVKTALLALYEVEETEDFTFGADFRQRSRTLAIDLCALKNPAFSEEREVRLAHAVNFIDAPLGRKLRSVGGTAWGKPADPQEIRFRMKQEIPVPYVALDYANGNVSPIKRVVLGPKNRNLSSNIEVYLNTIGIHGASVEKSRASYW
jgi:hypothetical protein